MYQKALTARIIGFTGSLLLTLAAYLIIIRPDLFRLKTGADVLVIFGFAFLQAFVQLFFFIDLWREKGPLWNLAVFISTLSIIFIVIAFSIWIINNLNYNMTP